MVLCSAADDKARTFEFEGTAHFLSTAKSSAGVTRREWKRMHVSLSPDCSFLKLAHIAPADCGGRRLAGSPVVVPFGPRQRISRHNIKADGDSPVAVEDMNAPAPHQLVLCDPQAAAPSIFCLDTSEEANRWECNLRAALGVARRPVWQLDDSATRCGGCDGEFNLFRRRHHCRCCGLVFCSSCVQVKDKLIQLNYPDKVRICRNCIDQRAADEAETVTVNPYLAWVRNQLKIPATGPTPAPAAVRDSKLSGMSKLSSKLSGFATIRGDWATASGVSIFSVESEHSGMLPDSTRFRRESEQSTDSAVAALCIQSMAAAYGSRRCTQISDSQSVRSSIDSLNVSQIRQVLDECEQLEAADKNTDTKKLKSATQSSDQETRGCTIRNVTSSMIA